MLRYHKDLYFPDNEKVKSLVDLLNGEKWQISKHSIDRIQEKSDIEGIGLFLKDLRLDSVNVFEYYKDHAGSIEKIVFRLDFDGKRDIILVLSQSKSIVTVYFNNKGDFHFTLNPAQYSLR